MSRSNTLSMYRTQITSEHGVTSIRYANTTIVGYDHEHIILRTGGYKTVTTKRKMNQASAQFGLGFGVFQRNDTWYVQIGDNKPVQYLGDTFTIRRNVRAKS